VGRRRGVKVSLRHINRYRDRHGKLRYYVRPPGGKNTPLPGSPDSQEFIDAYKAALANRPRKPIGAARNAIGSVASAVSLYLSSAVFAALAPDTRRGRRNELERFRVAHGEKPLALMERRHVEKYLKGKTPVSARNCLKALSPFMAWCLTEDLIAFDPTAGIKRPTTGNREGYATWQEEHVAAFRARHPLGSKARLAFELMVNTGAARVDLVRLGRQHVRDGILSFRRHKTNVLVEIPVLSGLQAILGEVAAAERLTFLTTEQGKPFTPAGFGNWFRDRCNEAGIPTGYSAHGVRKYAAAMRANLGATANELMAWFGWLTMGEAAHYTRAAERRRLAVNLGQKVNQSFLTEGQG
jgi:hypothetical protein